MDPEHEKVRTLFSLLNSVCNPNKFKPFSRRSTCRHFWKLQTSHLLWDLLHEFFVLAPKKQTVSVMSQISKGEKHFLQVVFLLKSGEADTLRGYTPEVKHGSCRVAPWNFGDSYWKPSFSGWSYLRGRKSSQWDFHFWVSLEIIPMRFSSGWSYVRGRLTDHDEKNIHYSSQWFTKRYAKQLTKTMDQMEGFWWILYLMFLLCKWRGVSTLSDVVAP